MAVAENGVLVNGSVHKSTDQPARPVKKATIPPKSASARLISTLSRLAIWYTIITCLFRCPSSSTDLTQSSPRVCKPYLTTVSVLKPHLEPYYETYAASHVERARPYVQQLDQKVFTPATQTAKLNYQTHAAPRIKDAKAYTQEQWEKLFLPQVEVAQQRSQDIYRASIAPHIEKASYIVEPYFSVAKKNALNVHQRHVRPALDTSKPYFQDAYGASQSFVLDTGIPYARWVWSSMVIFIDGTLWPQIRALYGDNVKPQLVMISERIAKYQEGRKLKASLEMVESSLSADHTNTSGPTIAATPEIISETPTPSDESDAVQTKPTGEEQIAAAREQIAADLHTWQEKFAKAADKGSEDLHARVKDIVTGLMHSEVEKEGRGLLTALKYTVQNEIIGFRSTVLKVVSALSDDASSSDLDAAESQVQDAIRNCASSVRDRATAIRQWHSKFQDNVSQRVSAAAESTVDILDGIRDLGLQEIGMRWAWMDGVTYKDWSKYHELKKQFDQWREEVRDVATKHEIIGDADKAAEAILEDAMDTASSAAKELVRLRDVAKWKIHARDSTDNFESRAMPAAAASAASKVSDKIHTASEDTVGRSQRPVESVVGKAREAAATVLAAGAPAAVGSSDGNIDSIASKATEAVAEVASSGSSVVMGTTQGSVDSLISKAAAGATLVASDASSVVLEPSSSGNFKEAVASAQSVAGAVGESVSSAANSVSPSTSTAKEDVSSAAGNLDSSASSIASSASKKVFAGAMAQKVSARTPILDDVIDESDEETFSEKVQSVINVAGNKYADVTKAVSEAMLRPTQGTVESVSSVASERYSSALAAASSVLFGTTKGTAEGVTSAASEKYSQAVSAASAAIYGTPVPVSQSLVSQANAAYSDALGRARSQYEQAKSIVSAQVSGTPKPVHEAMLSSVESAYSGSLATASGRLESALNAASKGYASISSAAGSLVSQPTPGPLESISSVASSNLQAALSRASAQYSSAKSAVGATPTPAHQQQYLLDAQQKYYAAMGIAHERYSGFVTAASVAVYGTPTPFVGRISNAASQAVYGTPTPVISSISDAASRAVYGTRDPAYQSAINAASSQFVAASSAANANLADFLASIKSGMGTTTRSPAQSVFDQASSQYNIALAAASSSLAAAASAASTAAYGTSTGVIESATSQALENWDALVSRASEQIYGAPTPVFASLTSQAGYYTSQATDAAAAQYANVQAFVSELVVGKEPDFTESVMNRLSAAYHTGYHASLASSASSLAGEAYQSASSVASSVSSAASSAASTYFTPPPQLESVLGAASDQLNAVVDAASVQVYGSSTGVYEQAKTSAANAYSSASSVASEKVYGTQTGYAEAAQNSMSSAISSAQEAISQAIYGTSTGSIESATNVAGDTYSSVSSVVAENIAAAGSAASGTYSSAAAKAREAVYGPEKGALESAQGRLSAALESAQARLAGFAASAGGTVSDAVDVARSNVENLASSVSSVASSVTGRVKDEL